VMLCGEEGGGGRAWMDTGHRDNNMMLYVVVKTTRSVTREIEAVLEKRIEDRRR
jgi:hypothetical protein